VTVDEYKKELERLKKAYDEAKHQREKISYGKSHEEEMFMGLAQLDLMGDEAENLPIGWFLNYKGDYNGFKNVPP